MKVLLAHNFYGSSAPSGENQAFRVEKKLLEDNGLSVQTYCRHSDEIISKGIVGTVLGAAVTPWNFKSANDIKLAVNEFQPDVVHVHNTFPLISPSIFHAVGKDSATVMTLHNYRIFCPAGIPFRSGKVCTMCIDKRSSIPSLLYGCYRRSRVATSALAASVDLHRRLNTWRDQVDAFIVFSSFQRDLVIAAGLPEHKVHIKPNFNSCQDKGLSWKDREDCVVFVGRLGEEKGIINLISAWNEATKMGVPFPELRIIGDGPLEHLARSLAVNPSIRFLGFLDEQAVRDEVGKAKLLVLPSECMEGFPMVLTEAFALGTPAAVSNLGPLPSIVRHGINGAVFAAADPKAIVSCISDLWARPISLKAMGQSARETFLEKYTSEENFKQLISIYNIAINNNKN